MSAPSATAIAAAQPAVDFIKVVADATTVAIASMGTTKAVVSGALQTRKLAHEAAQVNVKRVELARTDAAKVALKYPAEYASLMAAMSAESTHVQARDIKDACDTWLLIKAAKAVSMGKIVFKAGGFLLSDTPAKVATREMTLVHIGKRVMAESRLRVAKTAAQKKVAGAELNMARASEYCTDAEYDTACMREAEELLKKAYPNAAHF
jgi:hypothetical protein